MILAARNPDRLGDAAEQVDARSTAAFDVTDLGCCRAVLRRAVRRRSTTSWSPAAARTTRRWPTWTSRTAERDIDDRILMTLAVARYGAARMRPPGTLLFIGGTGGRQAGVGLTLHLGDDRGPAGR